MLEERRCIYCDQRMSAPVHVRGIAGGSVALFSTRGPEKETPNEDAAGWFGWDEHSGVLFVADGLGGLAAGERASRLALEMMLAALAEGAAQGMMLRTAILNGIERANEAVSRLGVGAATTLALVEISEGQMRPYHVGDSTILLVGGRGRVKWETLAHSPVAYAVAAGVLDSAEAMHHDERHLVSNVIGSPAMRIEIGPPHRLAARDTVLLSSDGLTDNLHVPEIVDVVRKGPLDRAARQLADLAVQRMTTPGSDQPSKPDDLTFVLFRP